jgi:hypothetical protein
VMTPYVRCLQYHCQIWDLSFSREILRNFREDEKFSQNKIYANYVKISPFSYDYRIFANI